MTSVDKTYFFFNLIFRSNEIDLYELKIQSKIKGRVFDLFDSKLENDLRYEEKLDVFFQEYGFTSRVYFACLDKIESHRDNIKVLLYTDKKKVYSSDLLGFKLGNVNVYYNLNFLSLKNGEFKDPPFIYKEYSLKEFSTFILFVSRYYPGYGNFFIQKITEKSFETLVDRISEKDKIEDVLFFLHYSRIFIKNNQLKKLYRKLDDLVHLIDMSVIPLRANELYFVNFIEDMKSEISQINNYDESLSYKVFLVMHCSLLHKNYRNFSFLCKNDIQISHAFRTLEKFKINYKLNKEFFERLIGGFDFSITMKNFIDLFSLIETDYDLIQCLKSSWKKLPDIILLKFYRSSARIKVSDIITFLVNKSAENVEKIFLFMEDKLNNTSKNNPDNIEITNDDINNISHNMTIKLSFMHIFTFDIENIIELFSSAANDLNYVSYLFEKANNYSGFMQNQSIIGRLRIKRDTIILNQIKSLKNCTESLHCLTSIFTQYDNKTVQNFLNKLRNATQERNIQKLLEKLTLFSKDPIELEEQLNIYRRIPFESFFNEGEIKQLMSREQENLSLKDYFEIYNKDKVVEILKKDNRHVFLNFLFGKLNKNLMDLKNSFVILIEFLNNLIELSDLKENFNINFEHFITNFFNEQVNSFSLEEFFSLYFSRYMIGMNKQLVLIFKNFISEKIKDLKIESYKDLIRVIRNLNYDPNNNTFLEIVLMIIDSSSKFLPNNLDYFLRPGLDYKLELLKDVFSLIYSELKKDIKLPIKKQMLDKLSLAKKKQPNQPDKKNEINFNQNDKHLIEFDDDVYSEESEEEIMDKKLSSTVINDKNNSKNTGTNLMKIDTETVELGNPFQKYLKADNPVFSKFYSLADEFNEKFFDNDFKINNYIILNESQPVDLKTKTLLLSIRLDEMEREDFFNAFKNHLLNVRSHCKKVKELHEFKSFYLKNISEKVDYLETFEKNYADLRNKKYKQIQNVLKDCNNLILLYEEFNPLDNESFKKIFDYYQNNTKTKHLFNHKIEFLKEAKAKKNEIEKFLYANEDNLIMKELIAVFLPLIDDQVIENLRKFKRSFKIPDNANDELISQVLHFYSQNLRLSNNSAYLIEFISKYKIKVSYFLASLNDTYDYLKEYEEKQVKEYLEVINKNNINNIILDDDLGQIIKLINDTYESYQFFENKEEDDLRNLIEFVDDIGDSFIKSDTIKNCLKVLDFYKKLSDFVSKKSDEEVILSIKQLINLPKYKNIGAYINDVAANFDGITQLYNKIANKEEYSKIKIKEMFYLSNFVIFQEKNKNNFDLISYKCRGVYGIKDKETNIEEIRDLRDRSLLLSKKKNIQLRKLSNNISDREELMIEENKLEQEENEYLEICKMFSKIVEDILIIFESLNYLYDNGYHKDFHVIFNVNKGMMTINFNNKEFTADKARDYFEERFKELEDSYEKLFKNFPLMTFFHGRQIFTLYETFILLDPSKIVEEENQIISEGIYLINFLCEYDININLIFDLWERPKEADKDDFYAVLEYVGFMIEKLNLELSKYIDIDHHKNNFKRINNNNEYLPGLYYVYLGRDKFEKDIIKIFDYFCAGLPAYKNILICDDNTSLLLIKSFIYRAFYFESSFPFVLVNTDELSNEIQLAIHSLINTLSSNFRDKKINMKSRLVITYSNGHLEYVSRIGKLVGMKNIDSDNIKDHQLFNIFLNHSKNIILYKSDASGVGKSFQIRKRAKLNKLKYNYFPISGVVEKFELIHRLKSLELGMTSLLHIDLNDCDNEYIIRSFLFELLITKCVVYNEFFYLSNEDIVICIEIPFGFIDFVSKYPILSLYQHELIRKNNKAVYEILPENEENMQIVGNYLLNLKNNNIINRNIYISCRCEDNKHSDSCQFHKSVPIEKLSQQDILGLINEHFNLSQNSFYQIEIFINFLAHQFKLFSKNFYFSVLILEESQIFKQRTLLSSRKNLVESFLEITKYFTKSAYDDLLKTQENSKKYLMMDKEDLQKNENMIIKNLLNENIISFNKINFHMIFFNNDGQGISIIVKKNHPCYQALFNLYNVCTYGKDVDLIDYEKLNNDEFLYQLERVLGKEGLVLRDHTGIVSLYDLKGYVFTSDNFLKMQLILLRINSRIPVIMMGETGCGKTSLIKMLANLIGIQLLILNIHAGISDKDIINFIESKVLPVFENNQTTWVFLDEINTCNSLGLISEILCKRTYLGKKFPENICFICACNPYRLFTNIITDDIGLKMSAEYKNSSSSLAYKVNPLPFSLLNYVFDFGSLLEQDEKNYIESMIEKFFKEEKIDTKRADILEIIRFLKEIIFSSQTFIRNQNSEISSVSLRDVRRFIIFFKWFKTSIVARSKDENSIYKYFEEPWKFKDLLLTSSLLSIFLIYYLRIPDKRIKNEFICCLSTIMSKYNPIYSEPELLLNILLQEERDIIRRIDPPKGIAWNSALLENVFAAFHGIINKVPVFICGKPGCSKSLAINLIYSALRGESSKDPYFKTLPRLFMNCYQGSITSKSSGIIKVFTKARNLLKGSLESVGRQQSSSSFNHQASNLSSNNPQIAEKIISCVFFDEMGLAEISKNNPLKVLHAELEPDQEADKVAFVGISNWKLDASKSNRGIFIGRPDLDEEDLIKTALTIAESYRGNDNDAIINDILSFKDIFSALAKTYFEFKKQISMKNKSKDGFHGSRDFYFMIKYISKKIINAKDFLKPDDIMNIVVNSINRNFSGYENSLQNFKSLLEKNFPLFSSYMDYNQNRVIEAIKSNLEDTDSRYLMIIGKATVSVNLIQNLLCNLNLELQKDKSLTFLIGSQFENDVEGLDNGEELSEVYSFKVLNKVQVYMEQGNLLVLSQLNSIYPSLYDLFNQNFAPVGGKKYARIALGTSNNPMALVHNDFKCIIILNESELEKQDPPFLNRFEKTIISFEGLLNPNLLELGNKIFSRLKSLFENFKEIKLDIFMNLINFNKSEVFGLIYLLNERKTTDYQEIEEKILATYIPIFSQDIIAIINYNLKSKKSFDELGLINNIYKKSLNNNLSEYLIKKINDLTKLKKQAKAASTEISMVYTYSSIFDEIKLESELIKAEIYAISSFRSEFDIEKSISNFLNKENNIFILKFRSEDFNLINYSKFLCEQILKNLEINNTKIFIFIIYTSRFLIAEPNDIKNNKDQNDSLNNLCENKHNISLISNVEQVFIDNLNNYVPESNQQNYKDKSNLQNNENFIDINDYFNSYNTNNSPSPFNVNIINHNMNNPNINEFDFSLMRDEDLHRMKSQTADNFKQGIKEDLYLNILDILHLSFGDMIKNKKLFDREKIFSYAIYNSYMRIGFDSDNYDDEEYKTYVSDIINLILETPKLIEILITKSCEPMLERKDDWFRIIMNKREFLKEKLDLISLLKQYLVNEFQICLTKAIYLIEQNDLFEFLLYNRKSQIVFETLLDMSIQSIKKLNFQSVRLIKDRIGGNIIKRYFGFKLPKSRALLNKNLPLFENTLRELSEKEEVLRFADFENNNDVYYEFLNEYTQTKNRFEIEFIYSLKSDSDFNYLFELFNNDNKSKDFILKNFIDDFIFFFKTQHLSVSLDPVNVPNQNFKALNNQNNINNIHNDDNNIILIEPNHNQRESISNKDIIKIIEFVVLAEFGSLDFSLEKFSRCVSFLLNNGSIIQKYVNICMIYWKYFDNYLFSLEKAIFNVKYPINNDTKYLEVVNTGHYRIAESLLQNLFNYFGNLDGVSEEVINRFLTEIKIIKNEIYSIDFSLKMYNKSVKKLLNIDCFTQFLQQEEKKVIVNFYKEYISLLEDESYLAKNNQIQELCRNLSNTYDLVFQTIYPIVAIKKINDNEIEKKFHQFLIDFLIFKFQTIEDREYRDSIASQIISDELLLKNSNCFIQNYFYYNYDKNFDLTPVYDEENRVGDPDIFGEFAKKQDSFIQHLEKKIIENQIKYEYLLQTIILIFEIYFTKYFINISSALTKEELIDDILYGSANAYFGRAFQIWDSIENIADDILHPYLLKAYVITYIRIYLNKFIEINQKLKHTYNFKNVTSILKIESKKGFVLRLYVLKILKEKYLKTWEALNSFDYNQHQMAFLEKEINLDGKEKKNNLANLFINITKPEAYKKFEFDFKLTLGQNYKEETKEFYNQMTDENLSLLLDTIINNILNLIIDDKISSKNNKSFCDFLEIFSQNLKLHSKISSKNIVSEAFAKIKNFDEIFYLKDQPVEVYEIYFVLFKYFILLLNSPKNAIYYYDISRDHLNSEFNKRFIPGTYNDTIKRLLIAYKEIKKINDLANENNASCIGSYLCSCETHYFVQPCGSPSESIKCFYCNENIGAENGTSHTLVKRPGHCRVYKNEKHRTTIANSYGANDAAFPFKYTDDLKNMLDDRITRATPDFVQISSKEISTNDITLPDIEPLTFRILNLIQNIFIYMSYTCGFINHINYNKCSLEKVTCKENIDKNISSISIILEKFNIKNVSLFLNYVLQKLVFDHLYETPSNITCAGKVKKESEINRLIINLISQNPNEDNFFKYKEQYMAVQKDFKSIDPNSIRILLDDEINSFTYDKPNLYPDYKFFRYKKELNKNNFINKFEQIPNYELEYPIIHNYIQKESSLMKVKNINKMNPFINEMINKFSYKISRKDAKLPENFIDFKLKELIANQENENSNKINYDPYFANNNANIKEGEENYRNHLYSNYQKFSEAWSEIAYNSVKFGCRKEMEPLKEITLKDPIAQVLNDDGEYRYGMYIAAGYQYLCEIQNEFLNAVKAAITNNIRLFYLKNNFNSSIIVQKAKPFQVIGIDKDNFMEKFKNFEDLIISNASVSCYNYCDIEFNYEKIEESLQILLIQGKKLFKDEQILVTYIYETFRGNNSAIITNFGNRIAQKPITQNEKFVINAFLQSIKRIDKVIATLTSMIFFLQNTTMNPDDTLISACDTMQKFVEIEKPLKEFFRNTLEFTIEKLVDIYNFVEKQSFEKIKENVSKDFREALAENKKDLINKFYIDNPNTILTKNRIATSVRRFISRFLTKDDDFDNSKELFSILFAKEEFWDKDIFNNEKFDDENYYFYDFDIKISESLNLYEFLGGDKEIVERTDNRILNNNYMEMNQFRYHDEDNPAGAKPAARENKLKITLKKNYK